MHRTNDGLPKYSCNLHLLFVSELHPEGMDEGCFCELIKIMYHNDREDVPVLSNIFPEMNHSSVATPLPNID